MRYKNIIESAIDHRKYDLNAKFDHYNRICFDGMLPRISLKFSVLKGAAGVCKYSWKTDPRYVRANMSKRDIRLSPGVLQPSTLRIILDKKYLRSENEIDAILVHEMIHAWFAIQSNFRENHGLDFLKKLRECESKTGLKIPVTEKVNDKEIAADVPDKKLIVMLIYREGREPFYAILNPTAYQKSEPDIKMDWITRGGSKDNLIIMEITSPLWTAHSFKVPIQRPTSIWGKWVGGSKKGATKLYYLKNPELIDDLRENGRTLVNLKNNPV